MCCGDYIVFSAQSGPNILWTTKGDLLINDPPVEVNIPKHWPRDLDGKGSFDVLFGIFGSLSGNIRRHAIGI